MIWWECCCYFLIFTVMGNGIGRAAISATICWGLPCDCK